MWYMGSVIFMSTDADSVSVISIGPGSVVVVGSNVHTLSATAGPS